MGDRFDTMTDPFFPPDDTPKRRPPVKRTPIAPWVLALHKTLAIATVTAGLLALAGLAVGAAIVSLRWLIGLY